MTRKLLINFSKNIVDIDLKEALDDLITFAKALPDYSCMPGNIKEYEGEYEENDWTEKHPSILIEISGAVAQSSDSSRDMIKAKIDFLVLIGGKIHGNKHPLKLASDFINELEGQEFIIGESTLYAHLKSVNFFARNKSLKVYALRWEMTN